MGGWVTAETLARASNLLGAVIISPGDFGAISHVRPRAQDATLN
jgi:hypothetical protein